MDEIPAVAIEALTDELCVHMFGTADDSARKAYQPIAERMLRRVEATWPHDPPGRDLASTTSASTAFGAQPSVPPYRRFGFGPAVVKA